MSAIKLDGKAVAAQIKAELKAEVAKMAHKPGLGTILVGEDPGSVSYVAGKHRDCAEIGIASIREDLPADASESEIRAAIERLNNNPECTGYIVQLPLPKGMPVNELLELIDPQKDADGLHPTNLGRLVLRVNEPMTSPLPCTPAGIIELLERYEVPLAGANVCVLGRGVTVGRSIGLLLARREINATVTCCHTGTKDVARHVKNADIVIAAVGVAGFVKPEWVKPGAVVMDVGVSRVWSEEKGKYVIAGDVDPAVAEVAGYLSPNPGGVGPMTRAMLLANVVREAQRQQGNTSLA